MSAMSAMSAGSPGSPGSPADDQAEVGERLKRAFAALAELPADERPRWHRRLIAVTNTTKRDLAGAVEQLDRYDRDWAGRTPS